MPIEAIRDRGISPGAHYALEVLLLHVTSRGGCWLRLEDVAPELGVTERTARRYLKQLEAAGYLRFVNGGIRFALSCWPPPPRVLSKVV
jgi:DNA-binding IclR family transcriptional regulator